MRLLPQVDHPESLHVCMHAHVHVYTLVLDVSTSMVRYTCMQYTLVAISLHVALIHIGAYYLILVRP